MKKITIALVAGTLILMSCNQNAESPEGKNAREDSLKAAKQEEAAQQALDDSLRKAQAMEAAKAEIESDTSDSSHSEGF